MVLLSLSDRTVPSTLLRMKILPFLLVMRLTLLRISLQQVIKTSMSKAFKLIWIWRFGITRVLVLKLWWKLAIIMEIMTNLYGRQLIWKSRKLLLNLLEFQEFLKQIKKWAICGHRNTDLDWNLLIIE